MDKLNLPQFKYKIKYIQDKALIFDIIRKKFVVLTPEEWVRQHFIHFLIDEYKYPKGLIKIETQITQIKRNTDYTDKNTDYEHPPSPLFRGDKERLHRLKDISPAYWADRRGKRCDLIIYDGSGQPYLIVECKAPSVKITQKTFDQIARYNYSLKAAYLIVTNGLLHFCCRIDHREKKYEYLDYIPINPKF